MTIALGILASDGIVVAADTEESSGYLKNETTKILNVIGPKDILGGSCVISGAGDSGYVSSSMFELADVFLDNKTLRGKVLQQTFEDSIKKFHDDHIIPFAAYPTEDRPAIELLIAHNRVNNPTLLISEKSAVIHKSPYAAVGCGSIFAEILLYRLWRYADTKMTEMLAAYILFMVKESIQGCGKYTQISTLHNAKLVTQDSGTGMVPADQPITFVRYEEIEKMEMQFRTYWQQAEQENLWNLIKQSISGTLGQAQ
jgi:hypothetical protein